MYSAAAPAQAAVLGHRGSPHKAPENTLESLRVALEDGADGFEFDVQRTADGELVVFHDEDVGRLTGEVGTVPTLRWRELRRMRVRRHGISASMPHLEEVFELLEAWPRGDRGRLLINLEMKATGTALHRAALADDVARAVTAAHDSGAADGPRWVVSSFDAAALRRFIAADAGGQTGALVDAGPSGDWRALAGAQEAARADVQLDAVHPHHTIVDQPRFDAWRGRGWAVHVWTANDERSWRPLCELGVDAIITDVPAALRGWLERPEVG